jgi:hypothetical protein
MFDQDFCDFLEYQICKAFEHSDNEEIKGFWGDGVCLNEAETSYTQQAIIDKGQITLKAFIGKDGQDEYDLTLKFGSKALRRFARNQDIKDCVPNPEKSNWFDIDTKQNKMWIQLE